MDVEGIIAVNGFKITNYVDNRAINKDAVNCLQLYQSDTYQPKLTIDKSVYIAYSNDITLPLDADTIQTRFDEKKEALINQQTTVTYDELDIPEGTDLSTENYTTIQTDFPDVYGIGRAGLSESASGLRQAQAKQLKGYLLFFEHLLAGYLSQLVNVKELFST